MKNIILILMTLIVLSSCEKQELSSNNQVVVIPPPNGGGDSVRTMKGTTWVITGYRIGQLGSQTAISDTLKFQTITTYKYNNIPYTYSFYPTGSGYNLTMNYTPWGNLSGSVNDNNMISGLIQGTKFVDISMGSSNTTEYYLWMKKI